jgi:hypothetical protein
VTFCAGSGPLRGIVASVSRTRCSGLALLRRAGTQWLRTPRRDGPRLSSAPLKKRCAASGAQERSVGAHCLHIVIASAAKHPDCLCGKTLDCFAALAMTEFADKASLLQFAPSSQSHAHRSHAFAFSRQRCPSLALSFAPSEKKGRREGRAPTGTRKAPVLNRCARNAQGRHRAAETRPSLRSGLTAYARSPRRRIPFASVASRIDDASRSGWIDAPPRRLGRSDDGRDHTVSPYASAPFIDRGLRCSRGSAQSTAPPCTRIRADAARVHRSPARGP